MTVASTVFRPIARAVSLCGPGVSAEAFQPNV